MPNWIKAPETVIHLATELIESFHEELLGASIGFVFRDEAPMRSGKAILGEASIVPEKLKPYLNLDFLIWLAEDMWLPATNDQRKALVDHELCHCTYQDGKPKIRPHDVEEFAVIILRYGAWNRDLHRAKTAFEQSTLPGFQPTPTIIAVEPAMMG